jgi:phosphate transport system substrate-binding protein
LRLKRHSLLVGPALLACLAIGLCSGTAAAAAAELTGAGSTLIAPLLEEHWAPEFEHLYGDKVKYGAVGSGAGIEQISARAVEFGASDAPLTAAQAATCNGCDMVPWALTATGIAYHLEGVGRLRLTGPVLADIYLGKITTWNSPAIAKLNKGEKLPNLPITVVYRSDGSGDTYAFTNYLSDISPEWRSSVGYATSVSFKTGTGAKGNSGVTAVVVATNGSIGYISASYIIAHHLSAAALKNAAGKYEFPNLKNIANAASAVTKVPANNELHIVDPSKKYKIAYPLSTFTYCIAPTNPVQKSLLQSWITYAITKGQKFGAALDFAPLPKVVLKADEKTIKAL